MKDKLYGDFSAAMNEKNILIIFVHYFGTSEHPSRITNLP
jgi:hypothetical protein